MAVRVEHGAGRWGLGRPTVHSTWEKWEELGKAGQELDGAAPVCRKHAAGSGFRLVGNSEPLKAF